MVGVSSRYRIVRRLGQGGMAEVFEGEVLGELGFVRKVAIKQLLPDALRDPMAARRFVDETRIASRLHHANVVAVLDVGVLDDRPFQVLELVDGLDAHALAQRAGGKLPVELALMLAHAVAHALDHAHTATDADGRSLGIVHRDVKPPNILVAWSGDVKLADFGIAVAHDRVAHTETGSVAGTRGFIAPEQRTRAQLDGRSDVFALGLTLHALCTGGTPLSDVMAEARLLGGEPLALDPALPEDVRAVIATAVAPDRRDRPTAARLAAAIGAALATRGGRDARTAVREYLSGFRTPPRRPGALDMLLGVDLVPIEASDGTVQRYATEAVRAVVERAAAEPAAVVPDAAKADAAKADATFPMAPARRGHFLLTLAAVLAVSAVVISLVVWRGRPDPAAASPITNANVPSASPRPAPSALLRDAGVATPPPVTAALAPAVATSAPAAAASGSADRRVDAAAVMSQASDAHRPNHPRPAPSHAPTTSHATTPPPRRAEAIAAAPTTAAPAAGHGYIQVVGEDLLRARVLIDGIAVGYVPNRFEVALGHHRVEVERPDGVRMPPRELDVTGFHTAKNPARPSW